MEMQQQQMMLGTGEPGAMVHQPQLALDENTLAEMRAAVDGIGQPIMQAYPMPRPQQPRDLLPFYMMGGMGCLLMGCCMAMVAIVSNPSAQVAKANEQMAAVAIAANERATCQVSGLIVLPGACPSTEASPQQQQQPAQQPGVVAAGADQPLPAQVPPAPNPYWGWDAQSISDQWVAQQCQDANQSQACLDLWQAWQEVEAQVQ